MSMTGFLFIGVLQIPNIFPKEIASLFTAFPFTFIPLILITMKNYKEDYLRVILRNTQTGMASIVIYSMSLYFMLNQNIDIYLATFLSLIFSIIYLYLYLKIEIVKKIKKGRT